VEYKNEKGICCLGLVSEEFILTDLSDGFMKLK
jgi:hypothetical protein